jgi:hypothetical protein
MIMVKAVVGQHLAMASLWESIRERVVCIGHIPPRTALRKAKAVAPTPARCAPDKRLSMPGTILVWRYAGRTLHVLVFQAGLEYDIYRTCTMRPVYVGDANLLCHAVSDGTRIAMTHPANLRDRDQPFQVSLGLILPANRASSSV